MPAKKSRKTKNADNGSAKLSRLLADRLPLFGHRNWIVIADSAYPAQSRPGIETIVTGRDQLKVVETVLAAVNDSTHVTPTIYLDHELRQVAEADASGVSDYRERLDRLLSGHQVKTEPHEKIIYKLDAAAQTFNILILKTKLTIPYTSVFLELGCGYWNAESEARLQSALDQREMKE